VHINTGAILTKLVASTPNPQSPVPREVCAFLGYIGHKVITVFELILVHRDTGVILASLADRIIIPSILLCEKHIAVLHRLGLSPLLSLRLFWCALALLRLLWFLQQVFQNQFSFSVIKW